MPHRPQFTAAALCALAVAAVAGGDTERAREATWQRATKEVFDPRWILPEDRLDRAAPAARRGTDLRRRVEDLLSARFPPPEGAAPDPRTAGLAGLLEESRRLARDPRALDAFLEGVRRRRPDVWRVVAPELPQVARQEELDGPDWDPADDGERDGMAFAPSFGADAAGTDPWRRLDGPRVQQAAAVIWADLDAIQEAVHDYAAYPSNVGASYEFIHAVRGSYLRGAAPDGRPFSALRVAFRCDLPFPYSHYDCDLRVLSRLDGAGRLVTDIYSTSPDFEWLAGQDVCLPVETPDGRWIATAMVRVFGFDLDDVPDGEGNVQEALRSSLGNLKRRAEARYRDHVARGGKPRTTRGDVPDTPVTGVR